MDERIQIGGDAGAVLWDQGDARLGHRVEDGEAETAVQIPVGSRDVGAEQGDELGERRHAASAHAAEVIALVLEGTHQGSLAASTHAVNTAVLPSVAQLDVTTPSH